MASEPDWPILSWRQVLLRTLQALWRSSPGGTLVMAVLTLVSAAIPPAQAYVASDIVESALAAHASAGDAAHASLQRALLLIALEFALAVTLASIERLKHLVNTLIGERLGVHINTAIMAKALGLELRMFDHHGFYNRLLEARREASGKPVAFVREHFRLVRDVLLLIGYVGIMLRFSPWAVALLAAAALPAFIAEAKFSARSFRIRMARTADHGRIKYYETVATSAEHAKEIRLFGLASFLLERHGQLAASVRDEERDLAVRRTRWSVALTWLSVLASYACCAHIVWQTATRQISVADLTLYIAAFRQGLQAFAGILFVVGEIREDSLYMSNLYAYLLFQHPPKPPRITCPVVPEQGVRLEAVWFRYDSAPEWSLRGIDLHIPARQRVALVGRNGAGKTTLVKLIAGLYEPVRGRVLLDGRDLRDWDPAALRRRFAVVLQDFCRYHWPLRDNIAVGCLQHQADDSRLQQAAAQGGLEPLLSRLPSGLGTQLGTDFKGGMDLSGGQWQAVALARAFMREEADICIFDEPTAALDPHAEGGLLHKLDGLSQDRTTIIISHRTATAQRAQRILVLEDGALVEDGSHGELMARDSRYCRMFGNREPPGPTVGLRHSHLATTKGVEYE